MPPNTDEPISSWLCCTCNGTGVVSDGSTCADCDGIGLDIHGA